MSEQELKAQVRDLFLQQVQAHPEQLEAFVTEMMDRTLKRATGPMFRQWQLTLSKLPEDQVLDFVFKGWLIPTSEEILAAFDDPYKWQGNQQ